MSIKCYKSYSWCLLRRQMRQITILTRVERVYTEVPTDRVSTADIFSLLHKQPVDSINGWSYIIRSQVKWCWFFACLFLQMTETACCGIFCPRWELTVVMSWWPLISCTCRLKSLQLLIKLNTTSSDFMVCTFTQNDWCRLGPAFRCAES